MFASRIISRETIELVDVEEPTMTGRTDDGDKTILFQPELTCLCGSDLPFFAEEQPSYPLADGLSLHEMIGTVLETSGDVHKPGDKVVAVPVGQVGFFERYEVSEKRAFVLDKRQPPEIALMAQPLGTAIYALRKLPPLMHLDVVVVGQGPMGQLFNACLKNLGARQIIGVDRVASRLEVSPEMGATAVVDSSREDPIAAVSKHTRGRMAHVVIEAVGHESIALNQCIDLCGQEAHLLAFGVPPLRDEISIRWYDLFFKNISIHASVNPNFEHDFPLAMRWISEGRIDVSPILTHRYAVEKVQEAFETFRDKTDGALKVLMDFPAGTNHSPNGRIV